MKKEKFTQSPMDDILNSIDGIQRAEASPFFLTRVEARLANTTEPVTPIWFLITRPAVSLSVLCLLLLLNVTAVTYFIRNNKSIQAVQHSGLENFAQEYNLSTASLYNDKPNP